MPAPINSNFSIYNPKAWVSAYLANLYPARPIVRNAVSRISGADLAGAVASKNKEVQITRAKKPTTGSKTYSGSYTIDEPDATEESLVMNKHEYDGFKIDKADDKFSMPELVTQHFRPRLENIYDTIDSDCKTEMVNFEAAFVDNNSGATILDDADLRDARKFMKKRKNLNGGMISNIDPDGEADLTGLNIFHQADQRGSSNIQLTGEMGPAFGFNFFVDNTGISHTAASVGDAVVDTAASAGDTTVSVDNGAGAASSANLAKGDVITFSSTPTSDEWYTVESFASDVITLQEPLRADVANDSPVDAVTGSDLQEELFYDPQALALVTSGLSDVDSNFDSGSGVARAMGFDPIQGVNFTVNVKKTFSGVEVVIEVLYGIKMFYEDRGIRYIRGTNAKA